MHIFLLQAYTAKQVIPRGEQHIKVELRLLSCEHINAKVMADTYCCTPSWNDLVNDLKAVGNIQDMYITWEDKGPTYTIHKIDVTDLGHRKHLSDVVEKLARQKNAAMKFVLGTKHVKDTRCNPLLTSS